MRGTGAAVRSRASLRRGGGSEKPSGGFLLSVTLLRDEETEHFQVMRGFLADRGMYFRRLFEPEQP